MVGRNGNGVVFVSFVGGWKIVGFVLVVLIVVCIRFVNCENVRC